MLTVGFVGWRGMVGSVLLQRMQAENDFESIHPLFFSTSDAGGKSPIGTEPLKNASDTLELSKCDVIVACQGGDYTAAVHPRLRAGGWQGYWLDAASTLRMADDSVIVLDPLNRDAIDAGLDAGTKDFIGGNCTVSLMMLAIAGLLEADLVKWVTAMTYQAISGGGAQQMRELLVQMGQAHASVESLLDDPRSAILDIDTQLVAALRAPEHSTAQIGAGLAGSLIPWVDKDLGNGQSREEWKGQAECNKIMLREADDVIPVESICVRIGAMRCHSQALTIKLKQDLPVEELEQRIAGAHEWVKLVANNRVDSIEHLNPIAITGSLDIGVGRVRKLAIEPGMYSIFTVGDQLLWGAAEPLRRMLAILVQAKS